MPEIALPTKTTQDQIKTTVDNIATQVNQKNTSKTLRRQEFFTSGTFTPPSGVTEVWVTGCGGGGSGAVAIHDTEVVQGKDGQNSSFGVLVFEGGKGGRAATTLFTGAYGGAAGGRGGQSAPQITFENNLITKCTDGGNCGPHYGGRASHEPSYSVIKDGGFGSGGGASTAAPASGKNGGFATGGGGADYGYRRRVTVTPLQAVTVTVGQGGARVANGAGNHGAGGGGNGYIVVEWYQ